LHDFISFLFMMYKIRTTTITITRTMFDYQ
jgi:hypothetical protein